MHIIIPLFWTGGDCMCKKEEKDEMSTVAVKKIDRSKYSGLSRDKKEILRSKIGNSSAKIDLNDVRQWWKYENN